MRALYLRLKLFKKTLDETSQYSDIPDGEMDVDRIFAAKPAFLAISDNDTPQKPRKLLLDNIEIPPNLDVVGKLIYKTNTLMALRQAMNNGFEIYQYRDGKPSLLTNLTLSEIFENMLSDPALHSTFMQDLELTHDDIAVVDTKLMVELSKEISDESKVLWLSDLEYFYMHDNDFTNNSMNYVLDTLKIHTLINNLNYEDISKRFLNRLKIISRVNKTKLRSIPDKAETQYLEKLEVFTADGGNEALYEQLMKTPELRILHFRLPLRLNIETLSELPLKKLEKLWLAENITASDIKQLLIAFPTLKKLMLETKKLDLSSLEFTENELAIFLPNIRELTELTIKLNDDFLLIAQEGKLLFREGLSVLDLGNSDVSPSDLIKLLALFPGLTKISFAQTELDLSKETITRQQLLTLLKNVAHVKKISLEKTEGEAFCEDISFETFKLSNLEEITFGNCSDAQRTIVGIIRAAPKLKKIQFNIDHLDLTCYSTLSESELRLLLADDNNCTGLFVDKLKNFNHLLQASNNFCARVKYFSIKNAEFSSQELEIISDKFPNLNALNVESSSPSKGKYSIDQLALLLKKMPQLKKLSANIDITNIEKLVGILNATPALIDVTFPIENMPIQQLIYLFENTKYVEQFHFSLDKLDLSKTPMRSKTIKKILENVHQVKILRLNSPSEFFKALDNGEIQLNSLTEIDFGEHCLSPAEILRIYNVAPKVEELKCKNTVLDLRNQDYTSSDINILLKNAKNYKKIYFGKSQFTSSVKELLLKQDLSLCEEIILTGNIIGENDLIELVKKCSALKKITHDITALNINKKEINGEQFRLLVEGNDKLQSISIGGCYPSDFYKSVTPFTCNFNQLHTLTIFGNLVPNNGQLNSLLIQSPNLKHLKLDLVLITDDIYKNHGWPHYERPFKGVLLKNLESLSIAVGFISKKDIEMLFFSAPNIKKINIVYAKAMPLVTDPCDILHYPHFDQLEELEINCGIDNNKERLLLNQATNIRSFCLKDTAISFSDDLVENPLVSLDELTLIRVTISANQLLAFLKKCPNLRRITIFRNTIEGDASTKLELDNYLKDFEQNKSLINLDNNIFANLVAALPPRVTTSSGKGSDKEQSPANTGATSTLPENFSPRALDASGEGTEEDTYATDGFLTPDYNSTSMKLSSISKEGFDIKKYSKIEELDLSNQRIEKECLKEILRDAPSSLKRIRLHETSLQGYSKAEIEALRDKYEIIGNYRLIDQAVQRPTDPDAYKITDANTTDKETTFNANRIFYSLSSAGQHPDPSEYRLTSFDTIEINENPCLDISAFVLKNTKDLKLTACPSLTFSQSDVYQEAIQLSKQSQSNCFYAKTTLLLSGQWQALPSLKSNDLITQAHLDPLTEVEIHYSKRDNLYYIRKKDDDTVTQVTIDYVVESQGQEPKPPPAIQKLRDYCNSFTANTLDMQHYTNPTGVDFLVEMAIQKVGACRHRSTVFKALLDNPELRKKIPALQDLDLSGINARIIINVSHSYVEVEENGAWIKYDLGGYPAKTTVNDNSNPLLQEKNQKALEELTLGKEISAEEVSTLLHSADKLKKLTFDTALSLAHLIVDSSLDKLEILDLGDRQLTAQELQDILGKAPRLKEITFKDCVLLSENTPLQTILEENKVEEFISLPEIKNYFSNQKKQIASDANSYAQMLLAKEESKQLIECTPEQLPGLCYQLQQYCQHTSHAYYTINSPDELVLRHPYVELQQDNSGVIKKGLTGPVYRFLSDSITSRTLIVNFANFSENDLARFNSLLDEEPSIDGVLLPVGTKVIGLIDSAGYKDSSVYSRFRSDCIEECPVQADKLTTPMLFQPTEIKTTEEELLTIEFYGAPNWQAKLLGTWTLKGDDLYFSPGILVKALEAGLSLKQIILKNPPLADPSFMHFFQEANLKGTIEYQGRRLAWTKPTLTVINGLEFSTEQIIGVERSMPDDSSAVINPNTFSRVLKRYDFQGTEGQFGKLFETEGILAKHPKNAALTLYVTENLSEHQWAQLLDECKNLGIKLQLNLAPSVTLPSSLMKTLIVPAVAEIAVLSEFNATTLPQGDCCIASNDQDATIANWKTKQSDAIFIDVSELSSSDLLTSVKGTIDEERLAFNFLQEQGALLSLLAKGKTVVLRGNFSNEMRQRLQVFLFERKKDIGFTGQVAILSDNKTINTFQNITPLSNHLAAMEEKRVLLRQYAERIAFDIINDENKDASDEEKNELLSKYKEGITFDKINAELPYVTQQALLRHRLLQASKEETWVGLKTNLPHYHAEKTFDLSTSEKQTTDFNDARLNTVKKKLQGSPFVFLAGMTGVGKTSFVEKVWKNKTEQRTLHVGEKQLLNWAKDKSPGIKAIFIDEANITRNNWSQFEGLFHNKPPGMMIGNEYIELTADHKIIFAGNPTTYSDDRTLPSLFERHGNSVVFEPLPPAYIYHEMLLPLFSDEDAALAELICRPILTLNQYFCELSKEAILLTPRELIMMAQLSIKFAKEHRDIAPEKFAKYYAYVLSRQFVPATQLKKFDTQFSVIRPHATAIQLPKNSRITLTESNKPTAQILTDFLALRKTRIESKTTAAPPGLGGVTVEGEPGLGKSELVIACLRAQGFTKRSLDATDTPSNQQYFYHLPAAANPKMKREILERAFNEGAIVIYDEINTAASLENLLNRLLMGKGPNGEDPKKPGFMLIGTQNPTTMAGRAKTSTALLHRMHYNVIPHYTELEMRTILREMGLPDRRIDALTTQYLQASKSNKTLCFRNVIVSAKEDLRGLLGKSADEIREADLLQLATDKKTNSEILETVYRHALCNDDIKFALAKNLQTNDSLLSLVLNNVENRHHADILQSIVTHPNANAEILSVIAKESANDEIFLTILTHKNCNAKTMDVILQHTKNPRILDIILKHSSCDKATLIKVTENNQDTNTLLSAIWHKHASQTVLLNALKNSNNPCIFKSLLLSKHCSDVVLIELATKTTDKTTLLSIISHPNFAVDSVKSLLLKSDDQEVISAAVDKIYKSGESIDFENEAIRRKPFIIEHAIKQVKEEDLLTLIEKTDNPDALKTIIAFPLTNNIQIFNAIIKKTTNTEIFSRIVEKVTDDSILGSIISKTRDEALLLQIVNKTNLINLLEAIACKTTNLDILNAIVDKNRSDRILLRIAQQSSDQALLTKVAEKTNNYDVLQAVVKNLDKSNSPAFIGIIKKTDKWEVLMPIVRKSDDESVLLAISGKSDYFSKNEANKKIVHISKNPEILIKIAENCSEAQALIIANSPHANDKTLKYIINNPNFYSQKPIKTPAFFSKPSVYSCYPLCAIVAMLKLLEKNYDGKHKALLASLVREISKVSNTVTTITAIDKLINSGEIGKAGGSGTLRKALIEISDSVKKFRYLDTDKILDYVQSKSSASVSVHIKNP